MKTEVVWQEEIAPKDGFDSVAHCIAFKPDGEQVLVAVGARVLVYSTERGELLHSLKGHTGPVYAVAFSHNGKRIASGGADKFVFIWETFHYKGILKYSHNDSIQCLVYNPVTQQLASATAGDVGLWSPEQKTVQKKKLSGKALCADWTSDGRFLAVGQFNGVISVHSTDGNKVYQITRNSPVWCLSWSPAPTKAKDKDRPELLAVGCWDQTLSFYNLAGAQQGEDLKLDYDPCSLCYYEDGEYLVMGGSNRSASLYTNAGVFLKTITKTNDWIWCIRPRPKEKMLAIAGNDGSVCVLSTVFSTVHGLYQDRYAYRDTMTDVMVQHLVTEQTIRIKTGDYVKKIAVYRGRLAIQLPDKVLIYETAADDSLDVMYKPKQEIKKALDCNLLVVTTDHIILCQERKLQLYDFHGEKLREWILDAVIRYIRVVGGPPRREGLLVGLKDGTVYKIYVDNRFPVFLVKHQEPIRCLDLSSSRRKLAVVDEKSNVYVYNLMTKEQLFSAPDANSVAWNTEMEDMFCFSGNGTLSIKIGDFKITKQPLNGFVVGFKGSKIFCLHYLSMKTVDVPQSASMYQYLELNDFVNAYKVACLGVTPSDWNVLAMAALEGLSLQVARKAFIRLRDARYIELLNRIEVARRSPKSNDDAFLAEIMAYKGNYDEAARLYVRAGMHKAAIEMFLDLRAWDKAKALVEELNKQGIGDSDLKSIDDSKAALGADQVSGGGDFNMVDLLKRQGAWLLNSGESNAAADMLWSAKEYMKAITVMGDNGWLDQLIQRVRTLNKLRRAELELAAKYFVAKKNHQYAKEMFLKLDDYTSLMALHVKLHKWDEAFALIKLRPELGDMVHEPYAEWLAESDRFDEAQESFLKARKPERALLMLFQLTENSIFENRFDSTAFYYWKLALETLKAPTALALPGSELTIMPAIDFDAVASSSVVADSSNGNMDRVAREFGIDMSDERKGNEAGGVLVKSSLPPADQYRIDSFRERLQLAQLYHAFHSIYRYTTQPFTSLVPEVVFQTAQYVLNVLCGRMNTLNTLRKQGHTLLSSVHGVAVGYAEPVPVGVSRSFCLFGLAKQGAALGAYKLARTAYNMLLKLKMPSAWIAQAELASLALRCKPFSDAEELQPECYRCSSRNPMLNERGHGDQCQTCGHPFVRNFITFEILPLVEFTLEDGISDEEAVTLIEQEPTTKPVKRQKPADSVDDGGDVQTMRFDDDDELDDESPEQDDAFTRQLMAVDPRGKFPVIRLGRDALRELSPRETFVQKWGAEASSPEATGRLVRNHYWKSVIPQLPIVKCESCQHFFHEEDFEFEVLKSEGHCCPFCRTTPADFQ